MATIAFVAVIGVAVASVVPSRLVASKRDCVERDGDVCTKEGASERVQFAVVPADAQPVEPRLRIDGPLTFASDGQVLFVTVRTPELSLLNWWLGRHNPAIDPKSYADLYATETPAQQVTRGQRDMRTAKETAEYVALSRLGMDAKLTPGDVEVDAIVCLKASDDGHECVQSAPSDDLLNPGDKLLKIDGVPLKVVDDLSSVLAKHKPGDTVAIDYERDGKPASGHVTLIAAPDEPEERAIVGFVPSDTATVTLPANVKITIDTTSIGGPSAGLAFTLTLIDQLSRGDLLGGKRVAATGTININAEVGPIGGLSSKASAVLQSGAKYFLVPSAQGETDIRKAREVVGDKVEIIPVATLDEALTALKRIGGDPIPSVPGTGEPTP